MALCYTQPITLCNMPKNLPPAVPGLVLAPSLFPHSLNYPPFLSSIPLSHTLTTFPFCISYLSLPPCLFPPPCRMFDLPLVHSFTSLIQRTLLNAYPFTMISNNAIVPALAPHESPKARRNHLRRERRARQKALAAPPPATLPETLPSQEFLRSRHNCLRRERRAQQRATTAPLPNSSPQETVPQEQHNERQRGRRVERRAAASVITSMAFLNIQPAQDEMAVLATSMAALDFHDNNVARVANTTDADTALNVTAAEQPAPGQLLAALPPTNIERWTPGNQDVSCSKCGAHMWARERLARSSERSPTFSLCCERSTVCLPLLQETPDPLRLYHESNLPQHKRFREQIRVYNSALAFTSVGVKLDDRFMRSGGVPTYRIHGQLSHRIGSLLPEQTGGQCRPMFAQLYIHDTSNELVTDKLFSPLKQCRTQFWRIYKTCYISIIRTWSPSEMLVRCYEKPPVSLS